MNGQDKGDFDVFSSDAYFLFPFLELRNDCKCLSFHMFAVFSFVCGDFFDTLLIQELDNNIMKLRRNLNVYTAEIPLSNAIISAALLLYCLSSAARRCFE